MGSRKHDRKVLVIGGRYFVVGSLLSAPRGFKDLWRKSDSLHVASHSRKVHAVVQFDRDVFSPNS